MCDQTYSGWTNRETWALMLWIRNDEGLQSWAHEYVSDYITHDDADSRTYSAAQALEQWTESLFTRSGYAEHYGDAWPDTLADIAEDIGSLWRVNYYECAESILSDMAEYANA